jgi:hypothetical protein
MLLVLSAVLALAAPQPNESRTPVGYLHTQPRGEIVGGEKDQQRRKTLQQVIDQVSLGPEGFSMVRSVERNVNR